jgi:hypothetical protein
MKLSVAQTAAAINEDELIKRLMKVNWKGYGRKRP